MAGDIKIKYGTSSTYTQGLASLASSTTLVAGWQTTVVDNTSTLADDYLVSGKITCGTTPTTGKQIEVWAFGDINTAGAYQDNFGASSASVSVSFANLKPVEMRSVATWVLDSGATTGSVMYFNNVSLKSLFGYVPGHHGLWIVQNTAVNLDATAGNHVLNYTPVFWQYT